MAEWSGGAVLITGASQGLGRAAALAFAAAGAPVGVCARGEAGVERVAAEVRAAGGRALARAADVADERAVRDWVAAAEAELGPVGVLVNNASVLGPRVPLAAHPVDAWRATLEVNLTGSLLATQAALPGMTARGGGVLIFISSGAAVGARREWGAYAVSKLAMEGMARNLAAELEGTGVRVYVVDPGAMRTDMRAAAYPAEDPATLKTPEEVAPLLVWLAGAETRALADDRWQADRWLAERAGG